MALRLNISGVDQVVSLGGRSYRLSPGWAIDVLHAHRLKASPTAVVNAHVRKELWKQDTKQIGIIRAGGIGDVIMLLPVLRVLLQMRKELSITLFTSNAMRSALSLSETDRFKVSTISRVKRSRVDFGISLEGVAERDHGRSRYATMPRHQLFAEALGILDTMKRLENCQDFSIKIGDADKRIAERLLKNVRRPIVGVQIRGNAVSRTLPILQIESIIARLRELGYSVIAIDARRYSVLSGDGVHQFPAQPLRAWMAILQHCDFIFTMDSGMLHVAHAIDLPVICFYGPTRIIERGAFHPSYDKRHVIAIELSRLVNCEACFMSFDRCRGKLPCMRRVPTSSLLSEVTRAAQEMRSTLERERASA